MDEHPPATPYKPGRGFCLVAVLVLAAAVLLLSKIVHVMYPPPAVPLFEPAAGLRTFPTVDAAVQAGVSLRLPAEAFGAQPYAVAQYMSPSPLYPAGTTDTVYAAGGARRFDVMELPVALSDPKVRALEAGAAGGRMDVNGMDGRIFLASGANPVCLDATRERPLRVCQIGARLVFGGAHGTFIILEDGDGLTEGEMIAIARSMPAAP